MFVKEIKKDIHWVGILNPALRVFDIIMQTEFGTTYNAYIVKGTKKTALIDTAHKTFFDQFISNINEVSDIKKIDYLIVNHCEPDHTGCIAELLKLNPNLEIYLTKTASVFLKNIVNMENINFHIIQDLEELDLGNKTLKFISAPFLHWPDSMFTYLKEDKMMFTCDFLGSHYCEPSVLDKTIVYKEKYDRAFKYYYDCIFGPFKPHVLNGLKRMKEQTFDTVCPSHGPVLTTKAYIDECMQKYHQWAQEEKTNILPVIYCSAYGNTRKIAEVIAETIKKNNNHYEPKLFDTVETDQATLIAACNAADAFCLGTPTINRAALPPITNIAISLDGISSSQKKALTFGSFGWSGEGVGQLNSILKNMLVNVFEESIKVCFVPSEQEISKTVDIATRFAKSL